jgi:hypothetical protein
MLNYCNDAQDRRKAALLVGDLSHLQMAQERRFTADEQAALEGAKKVLLDLVMHIDSNTALPRTEAAL